MKRRDVLKALAGLFAVPAIVKAEPPKVDTEPCCVCGKPVRPIMGVAEGWERNRCDICGGLFCSTHGTLVEGSRDAIDGREVIYVNRTPAGGKLFVACEACREYEDIDDNDEEESELSSSESRSRSGEPCGWPTDNYP